MRIFCLIVLFALCAPAVAGAQSAADSVRVDAATWVDYLHLGKLDGEWKIINVLWEMRPASR